MGRVEELLKGPNLQRVAQELVSAGRNALLPVLHSCFLKIAKWFMSAFSILQYDRNWLVILCLVAMKMNKTRNVLVDAGNVRLCISEVQCVV